MRKSWVVALAVVAGGCSERQPAAAAASDTAILDAPDAEIPARFGELRSIAELADGRVVVVDGKENAVFRVDFNAATTTKLGTPGPGPGEYDNPGGLLRLPGDTLWLADFRNHRFGLISPQGELLPQPAPPLPGLPYDARTDAAGRLYADQRAPVPESLTVTRFTRDGAPPQPIVRVGIPSITMTADISVGELPAGSPDGVPLYVPFAGQRVTLDDAWDVLPDGRVMVVRARPFRVDIVDAAGSVSVGTPIPNTPIPLTAEQRRVSPGVMNLPAFHNSGSDRPMSTPHGELWVHRTMPGEDTPHTFDVFDGSGKTVRHVVLRASSRLLGFGPKYVYVVRDSADGQALRRYPYPPPR